MIRRRRTERRDKSLLNEAGLTLLEVLLAAVILALAAGSVFNLLAVAGKVQSDARRHMEALRVAESVMEEYRARPADELGAPGEPCGGEVTVAVAERDGLKVVTVTVFYGVGEGEKAVSLTLERAPR